jgi:hypothetical protein
MLKRPAIAVKPVCYAPNSTARSAAVNTTRMKKFLALDIVELLGILPVVGTNVDTAETIPGRAGQGQDELMIGRGAHLIMIQAGVKRLVCGPALSSPSCLHQSGNRRLDDKHDDLRWSEVMAGRLNGYSILILETREEAQFSRPARRTGRRAAMPDVHHPRCA